MPLLDVRDLTVEYRQGERVTRAVSGVSFQIEAGQSMGLVGESGCGKSTTARALLRLLPPNAHAGGGAATFRGTDLLACTSKELRKLRWQEIAMVPQTSMNSLDPVYRVGDQIREPLRQHTSLSRSEINARTEEVARIVGLDPRRMSEYPHQFSGGMRQRLVLAMALVLDPSLLIADEPTTALDVITQHRILEQVVDIQRQLGLAVLFITHDIGVVWRTCEQVAVMYAGRIVESGATSTVLTAPGHPYTMGLLNASPSIRSTNRVVSIPGHPPPLDRPVKGCAFAVRCPFATTRCTDEAPALRDVGGQLVACHHAEEAEDMRVAAGNAETWTRRRAHGEVAA